MKIMDKNTLLSEGTEIELEAGTKQGTNTALNWHSLLLYVNKRGKKRLFPVISRCWVLTPVHKKNLSYNFLFFCSCTGIQMCVGRKSTRNYTMPGPWGPVCPCPPHRAPSHPVQDPRPYASPQGHQPLPQQCYSMAGLQLPTAQPCPSIDPRKPGPSMSPCPGPASACPCPHGGARCQGLGCPFPGWCGGTGPWGVPPSPCPLASRGTRSWFFEFAMSWSVSSFK